MKNKHLRIKSGNLILIFTLFLVTLVISISSCNKDNPVNSSNGPAIVDSNIFDWQFDTIYTNPGNDFYVADTNQIIIPGSPNSIYINNGSVRYINHNDNGFVCYCANGTDINNVYLGGIDGVTSKPKLKKWNVGGIVDIPVPDSISTCIQNIVCISDNDIWMSTTKNVIFHYVNNSFTTYRFDANIVAGVIFKDNMGNLFSLKGRFSQSEYNYIYLFKFENNTWIQVCKDSTNNNTEMGDYIGFSGDKILRRGKSGIYYFTGNNWEKYINIPNNLIPILIAGGESPENVLFVGRYNNIQDYLFCYNSNKFFKLPHYTYPNICYKYIKFKYGRYYITTDDYSFENYFLTLKLKK